MKSYTRMHPFLTVHPKLSSSFIIVIIINFILICKSYCGFELEPKLSLSVSGFINPFRYDLRVFEECNLSVGV
jgi:hypothetical protein